MSPETPRRQGTRPTAGTTPGGTFRVRPPVSTPTASPLKSRPKAEASPQVKAALAALRAKNRAVPPTPSANEEGDAFSDPSTSANDGTGSLEGESGCPTPSTVEPDAGLQWGMKSIASLVEAAKNTGRLNVSSRELKAIPHLAYSTLMPIDSRWHPSHRTTSPGPSRTTPFDYSLEEPEGEGRAWFQQVDLKALIVANNELEAVEEEIAGFEDLELLDLHNNRISALPDSFALLATTLTSLNLAANSLSTFPLAILALKNLRSLDLSSNELRELWAPDWSDAVTELVATATTLSPSATPESVKGTSKGMSGFSSAPGTPSGRLRSPTAVVGLAPLSPSTAFPNLISLNLSFNKFTELIYNTDFSPRLTTLDLSFNRLRTLHVDTATKLASLPKLSSLDLSGNPLSDNFFNQPLLNLTSAPFPSLSNLDLSRASIDSLGPLESFFSAPIARPIAWDGLSKVINNLVAAGEGRKPQPEGLKIEIQLLGCPLRNEQARRRAEFDQPLAPPSSMEVPIVESTPVEKDEAADLAAGLSHVDLSASDSSLTPRPTLDSKAPTSNVPVDTRPITPVISPSSSPSPSSSSPSSPSVSSAPSTAFPPSASSQPEADALDAAVVLVSSGLNPVKGAVILSSKALNTLPTPSTGFPPARLSSPHLVDLSANVLLSAPLKSIDYWGWSSSLKILTLSRNRITTVDFLEGLRLPQLTELDLSSNRLTSTIDFPSTTPLLSVFAIIAPQLTVLDLSHNYLTTTDGIASLLSPTNPSRSGVRELRLLGNKISDVKELTDVARCCQVKVPGTWNCLLLDLQNNAIARSPTPKKSAVASLFSTGAVTSASSSRAGEWEAAVDEEPVVTRKSDGKARSATSWGKLKTLSRWPSSSSPSAASRRADKGKARADDQDADQDQDSDVFEVLDGTDVDGQDDGDGASMSERWEDEACFVDDLHGQVDFLSSLPHEISLYILLHLDFRALLNATAVSRQWRSLAQDHLVWRDLFHQQTTWKVREGALEDEPQDSFSLSAGERIGTPSLKRAASASNNAFFLPAKRSAVEETSESGSGGTMGVSRIGRRLTDMMSELSGLSLTPLSGGRRGSVSTNPPTDGSSPSSPAVGPEDPSTSAAGRTEAPASSTEATRHHVADAVASPSSPLTPSTHPSGALSRTPSSSGVASLESSTSSLPTRPSRRASHAILPPQGPVPSPSLGVTPSAPLFLNWPKLYRDRYLLEKRWERGTPSSSALRGHTDSVYCLQFDQSKVISGSRDKTVRIWDLQSMTCVKILEGHEGSILCLQYDDKILVTGSSDCRVMVWDLVGEEKTGKGRWMVKATLVGHNMGVLDLCFNDKWIVSCSKDTTVKVWNRNTGELHRTLSGHGGPVNAVQLLNDKVISASGDSLMKMWDVNTGEVVRVFTGHERGLACVQYAPSGKLLATGSNDQTIKIWDAETGECLLTLEGHTDLVRSLAFDETRRTLVSGSYDRTLRVWNLDTGDQLLRFKAHTSLIFDVSFSASRILSCSHDQKIMLTPLITRVLGGNPGKFTLQGTNTYLIGPASSLLLIDTAEGLPLYLNSLRSALSSYPTSPSISNIILTHWHRDHIGGLVGVLDLLKEQQSTPPKVWKLLSGEKDKDEMVEELLRESPEGSFTSAGGGRMVHGLEDGQVLEAGDARLKVLSTPGHTKDSISLLYTGKGVESVLFTADTVLGHGTAVFEDLGAYMASLRKLIEEVEKEEGPVKLFCGHGEVVEEGLPKLREYFRHRQEREDQVVASLGEVIGVSGEGQFKTATTITTGIYKDTIPESLIPAATRGVVLHLEKLERDGKVVRQVKDEESAPLPGWNDLWKLTETGGAKM
ncbi:F-box and WD-40 domain protein 1/11 [Pseudohyphozyma bogoriensis]|nr:F-box and WD-40 domain protein 1/11 [Pseudohyphozyma bogoriensis]